MTYKILVLMMFSALAFGQIPTPDFAPYKWAHVEDFISLNPPTSDVTGTNTGVLTIHQIVMAGGRECADIDKETNAVKYLNGCTPEEALLSALNQYEQYAMDAADRERAHVQYEKRILKAVDNYVKSVNKVLNPPPAKKKVKP